MADFQWKVNQNPEFRNNPENFTHVNLFFDHTQLLTAWKPLTRGNLLVNKYTLDINLTKHGKV